MNTELTQSDGLSPRSTHPHGSPDPPATYSFIDGDQRKQRPEELWPPNWRLKIHQQRQHTHSDASFCPQWGMGSWGCHGQQGTGEGQGTHLRALVAEEQVGGHHLIVPLAHQRVLDLFSCVTHGHHQLCTGGIQLRLVPSPWQAQPHGPAQPHLSAGGPCSQGVAPHKALIHHLRDPHSSIDLS